MLASLVSTVLSMFAILSEIYLVSSVSPDALDLASRQLHYSIVVGIC